MRHEFAEDEAPSGIDLLPLIDVVFLLLVFFLAATTFARDEVALDLKLPEAKSGRAAAPARQLVVNVHADGRLVVDGREVTLEGLRQKLAAAGARDREQPVVVRGDTQAQFGLGLQVLDACRMAKLLRVDFAALPSQKQ
jgi:biopolymer transport protein ExbD